jgi:preprotein translocase subunit SecG
MKELIQIFQILISVFLIVSILIQPPRRLLGPYFKRRGIEKIAFFSTILFTILFVILAILNWIV